METPTNPIIYGNKYIKTISLSRMHVSAFLALFLAVHGPLNNQTKIDNGPKPTAKPNTSPAKPLTTTGKPLTTTGKALTTTGKPLTSSTTPPFISKHERYAKDFIFAIEHRKGTRMHRSQLAAWNYESDMTNENLQKKNAITKENSELQKKDWALIQKFDWKSVKNPTVKRLFEKNSKLGMNALPKDKYLNYQHLLNTMKKIYSTTQITITEPVWVGNNLSLDPNITDILATSEDPAVMKQAWTLWHDIIGHYVKPHYLNYVKLANEGARSNGFNNAAEMWQFDYETPNLEQAMVKLWSQLKPLYLQLHAYVRFKLVECWPGLVNRDAPIPAHLLGNMWAQSWRNLASHLLPYPDKEAPDIKTELKRQKYTPLKIFKTAESFFTSLNLSAMPESFWKNSIFEKVPGKKMICHGSAHDFYDAKDFRIRMCTTISTKNFITIHHEMGHVQYYLQYKHLPPSFRRAANPGFHEAAGDVISLSVQSSKHLRKIGLLPKDSIDDYETTINSLFEIGLDKIVFLPYSLIMDLWRWDVFKGRIKPEEYNCKWWKLKQEYQGVDPPSIRKKTQFDIASKYHTVAGVPYIKYFISFVVQFQMHRGLCKIAGEYVPNDPRKPLHRCDIYNNKKAGNVFKKMLQMGSSKPWQDALQVVTGQRNLDASALLEYFKPLHQWLIKENKKNNVKIGWTKPKNCE